MFFILCLLWISLISGKQKHFKFFNFMIMFFYCLLQAPKIEGGFLLSCSVYLDYVSWALILLSFLIVIAMIFTSKSLYNKKSSQMLESVMISLFIILVATFSMSSLLNFYLLFEFSLLPILIMILGWGYQPERVKAGFSLMVYTVSASLPFFSLVVYFVIMNKVSLSLLYQSLPSSEGFLSGTLTLMFLMAFLVKFPMFLVHLWLPKAHVEAPVAGSMVLAAILLKLGGYGMIRISGMLNPESLSIYMIQVMSLLGASFISFLCLSQKDLKVVIAYSSVAHMGLVIAAILFMNSLSVVASLFVMIAHGFSSSAMFMSANLIYLRSHTRNMLFSKGVLSFIPLLTLCWFIICLANMGGPPTLNLVGEIFCIMGMLNYSIINSVFFFLMTFLAAAFTLLVYASTQQGQSSEMSHFTPMITFENLANLSLHLSMFFLSILLSFYFLYIYISS